MTTLLDVMLETARLMGTVREGTATDGTVTSLIDTHLDEPADYYTKGTLWLLSGDNDELCDVISMFAENEATIETTLTNAIAAGDEYAIATPEFPKHKLKQAVLAALRTLPLIMVDDTLETVSGQKEYDLPVGVSDIKRVLIDGTPLFNWNEYEGKLVFDKDSSGTEIKLWYKGVHGAIDEDEEISQSVDIDWLKWSAVVFLYRDKITRINKDNPTDLDLLNEAKVMESEAVKRANKFHLRSMSRDPKIASW